MTDPETGAPPMGPPARPPGPPPAGYVPREWWQQAPPPAPVGHAATASPDAVVWPPGAGTTPPPPPVTDVPFLDTPWVPPRTPRQGWYWLVFAVAGFVVGQLGAVVFATISGAVAGKSAAQMQAIATSTVPPEWYVVSTLIGLWIGFLGAPWLASRTQGTKHFGADLGLRFRWRDLLGILIGIGGQVVITLMYAPFQHDIKNFNAPSQRLTGASHGSGFVIIAIATVLLAPAAEEIFFRGLLLKALVRLFTPLRPAGRARAAAVVLAVIADGLLFGAAHGEWVQFAGLAFFGVVLAAVSYRTGRLGMNMAAHATFNLIAIVAIALNGSIVLVH